MSTLIVPSMGRKIINDIPQYLNYHPNGKLLIERSIEGVYSEEISRVLIVLKKQDEIEYRAMTKILNEVTGYPLEVIMLDAMTAGPAATVYQAILSADISGPIVVKDSDNYLLTAERPKGNFVAGLDLNTWEGDIHNLRNKSFLIVNEQGNLLDIIEKQVRSDMICLGLYGFQKAEDFVRAYEHLNNHDYPITKLYVSHIISYLIGYYGRVFHYIPCMEYENWGDERLWKELQRVYSLYLLDIDHILRSDGTLSESNQEKLSLLQKRGASFIGCTVRDERCKSLAEQTFRNAGLRLITIVYGIPYVENMEIIRSEEELIEKAREL